MKRLPLAAFAFLAAMPVSAQKAPVPDLLKRAFSAPASNQLYAYDFENVNEGDQGKTIVRGRIDPSRKKGDRVTITFVEDKREKPADARKMDERYERNAEGDIFCDTFSKEDVTNAVDMGLTAIGRLFAFTPKAEADADGQIKDLMKKMSAQAVVDETTATLRSFTATLTKTHNIMLVAEVKAASISSICAAAPNGRAYATRTDFSVTGSALGQNFSTKSVQTVSNITLAGLAPR